MVKLLKELGNYLLKKLWEKRFGRYSKYIIQERALPDIRDGFETCSTSFFMQCIKIIIHMTNLIKSC